MSFARQLVALALALAPAAGARAQGAEREVLSLEEAVRLALAHNRRLEVAGLDVERAEQKVAAAKTRRLPQFDLQAMAGSTLNSVSVTFPEGAFGTYPGTGPIPAQDAVVEAPRSLTGNINATVAQPLTGLHRIGLSAKLSEIARDIEKEKLREQRAAVAAEARRQYYALLQAESALFAAEEQVKVYRELDRVVGEQVAIEVALKSDGLEVKARLASEEYRLAGLRHSLATGKEQMNHLLGRDLGTGFALAEVPEASLEEVDLPSAVSQAMSRRADLAQARLNVERADTDRRLKKAEAIPDLSLAVTYYSFYNVDLLPRNLAQAGLQLTWEPFDWGRKKKERAEKMLQVQQARRHVQEAESQARLEVAHHFRKLEEARLLVRAERLGREAAHEKMRTVAHRYQEQAALLKDVLETQAALSSADSRYDRARLQYWTARADLQQALGEEL